MVWVRLMRGRHAHFVNFHLSQLLSADIIVRFRHETSTSENKILNLVMGNTEVRLVHPPFNNSTTLRRDASRFESLRYKHNIPKLNPTTSTVTI